MASGYNPYNPPKLLPGQLNPSEVVPQAGPNGKYVIGARPGGYGSDTSNNGGAVPHAHAVGHGGAAMSAQQVRAMQQFLNNHGFTVAQDGIMGPQTKSAAAAFRANHKGGAEWSKANGIGVHPADAPHDPSSQAHVTGHVAAPPAPGGGSQSSTSDGFSALLASLLGQGGNVGHMLDPNYYGTAAAAPDQAQVQTLLQEIGLAPKQEAQNQHDISSWYGLNPNDPNYNISVLGRLGQARAGDAKVAGDASANSTELAAALAGSIGGDANGGAGALAAAGANDAGLMAALGKANTDYADNMNPLLAADARGQMLKEKATSSQAMLALQQALAQARGQATADAATGRAGAIDKNNALSQQQFANKGNLLGIMSQLQSAGLDTNYKQAQIAHMLAEAGGKNPGSIYTDTYARAKATADAKAAALGTKVDINKTADGVIKAMGLSNNTVPTNAHSTLAQQIGAQLRAQGLKPSDPNFKKLGDALFGMFVDQHGRPLVASPNWAI